MITGKLSYPLRFSAQDAELHPLEELAGQMRVSRALLRICLEAGCPSEGGRMSAAGVLLWLFDHYEQVRTVTGLKEFVAVEGLPPPVMAHLRMVNALVTLLEYGRMRATDWRQKRQLRRAVEQVDRLADRAS